MDVQTTYFPTLESVEEAAQKLKGIALVTPLSANVRFSNHYGANIYFKR